MNNNKKTLTEEEMEKIYAEIGEEEKSRSKSRYERIKNRNVDCQKKIDRKSKK